MIKVPTVLILGAGASKPFDYPTGLELFKKVCTEINNGTPLVSLLKAGFSRPAIDAFAEDLRFSGKNSVDAFLEQNGAYLEIGRAAIAACLIPCEKNQALFDLTLKGKNWYDYLLDKLGTQLSDFEKNRISIITYNYDRSLEQYLSVALARCNGASIEDVSGPISSIPIIHLHGKLGDLEWQSSNGRKYSANYTEEEFDIARKGIKIVHEAGDNLHDFNRAKHCLQYAERIIFLGFGYSKINLLRLDLDVLNETSFGGTALNMDRSDRDEVERMFIDGRINLQNMNVFDYLTYSGVLNKHVLEIGLRTTKTSHFTLHP